MKCLLLLLRELLTLDSSVVSTCVFNAIDGWHIIFFSCPIFVLGFFRPFDSSVINITGSQVPRRIRRIHVLVLQQQQECFHSFVSSPVHSLDYSTLEKLILTEHHSYAAVLVVFLGNFNPSTLTG